MEHVKNICGYQTMSKVDTVMSIFVSLSQADWQPIIPYLRKST